MVLAVGGGMVGKYLIASYLYYILDFSIMDDTEYDQLCKDLLARIDYFKANHPHGHLLDEDALRAGTGHQLTEMEYPIIVKVTASMVKHYHALGMDYFEEVKSGSLHKDRVCHSASGSEG